MMIFDDVEDTPSVPAVMLDEAKAKQLLELLRQRGSIVRVSAVAPGWIYFQKARITKAMCSASHIELALPKSFPNAELVVLSDRVLAEILLKQLLEGAEDVYIHATAEEAHMRSSICALLNIRSRSLCDFGYVRLSIDTVAGGSQPSKVCLRATSSRAPEIMCLAKALEENRRRIPPESQDRGAEDLTPLDTLLLSECPFLWMSSRLSPLRWYRGVMMGAGHIPLSEAEIRYEDLVAYLRSLFPSAIGPP